MSVNVLLPARIRWNGPWVAARVTRLAIHEITVAADPLPAIRTYVEVRVGDDSLTACVASLEHATCLLKTRDRVDVARLLAPRSAAPSSRPQHANASFLTASPALGYVKRPRAERGHSIGSMIQYVTAALVALGAAGSLGWEVYKTMSAPIKTVEAQISLDGR